MVSAVLAILDERGLAHPYLAEALPQLDSLSWQVFPDGQTELRSRQCQQMLAESVPSVENGHWRLFPDGRMETVWKIRPSFV